MEANRQRELTDRDREVLVELECVQRRGIKSRREPGFVTPLDIGGSSRSHHSNTLLKLARRGLVTRHKSCYCKSPARPFCKCKTGCTYSITPAGLEAIRG